MEFLKANLQDVDNILKIIQKGREYLKDNNVPQWQDGYPSRLDIEKDIKNGTSYKVVINKEIVATCSLQENEELYNNITNGNWLNKDRYICAHRVTCDKDKKDFNVATFLMNSIFSLAIENNIYNIRIDTHEDNRAMLGLLNKFSFVKCGILSGDYETKRVLLQKTLDK